MNYTRERSKKPVKISSTYSNSWRLFFLFKILKTPSKIFLISQSQRNLTFPKNNFVYFPWKIEWKLFLVELWEPFILLYFVMPLQKCPWKVYAKSGLSYTCNATSRRLTFIDNGLNSETVSTTFLRNCR